MKFDLSSIKILTFLGLALSGFFSVIPAEASMMRVRFSPNGNAIVVNHNADSLPHGCRSIRGTRSITVRAGRKYANEFPGDVYTYNQRNFDVEGCTRLTVTFVNEDFVRHQWMVHGLPRYLYPGGMFTLTVTGPGQVRGSFIVPDQAKTYLIHCDVTTHTARGMKAQLKVNGGNGNIHNIPGITDQRQPDNYDIQLGFIGILAISSGVVLGILLFVLLMLI